MAGAGQPADPAAVAARAAAPGSEPRRVGGRSVWGPGRSISRNARACRSASVVATQQRAEPGHRGQLGPPCRLVLCAVTYHGQRTPRSWSLLPTCPGAPFARPGPGQEPWTGPSRRQGPRRTGLLGSRPRAMPLRVAPGEARGHVVSSRLRRFLTAMLAAETDDSSPRRRTAVDGETRPDLGRSSPQRREARFTVRSLPHSATYHLVRRSRRVVGPRLGGRGGPAPS